MKAVKNFFHSGRMIGEVSATCITLVPKVKNPLSLGDYRLIACSNVVYKCITKFLTNRKKFIDSVVFRISLYLYQVDTYRIISFPLIRYCMNIIVVEDREDVQ